MKEFKSIDIALHPTGRTSAEDHIIAAGTANHSKEPEQNAPEASCRTLKSRCELLISALISLVLAAAWLILGLFGWRKKDEASDKLPSFPIAPSVAPEPTKADAFARMARPANEVANLGTAAEKDDPTSSSLASTSRGVKKSLSNLELRRLNLRCQLLEKPDQASVCSCYRCVKRMRSELFSSFENAKSQGHIVVTSEDSKAFAPLVSKKRHSLT
mmetsp:Transcript_8917/g.20368  ORF Transcript_8917/g.20368 Transcript_8917/m.20368 type:complete len:215 (-) Transcript_8917:36-680(-)